MAQVTGGLVSVEDGLKKQEDYAPPRKVRVDLTFSVEEGGDFQAVFDHVSVAAATRVSALLNGTSFTVIPGGKDTAAPAAEPEAPKTRRRRASATANPPENPPANEPAASNTGEELPDDPTNGEEHVIHLPDETALEEPDEAEALEDEFTVEPDAPPAGKEISDADLNAEVQRKNAELKDPNIIRGLIREYNPDPSKVFQLREIPQAKRGEFLTKLKALKKAG